MTAGEVLERCQREGIVITPTAHGTLRVRGQRLPPELLEAVRATKPEILRLLRDDERIDIAEVYSRVGPLVETRRVRIKPVQGAGVGGTDAWQLVDTATAKPLGVGLFVSERWARAWCQEYNLDQVQEAEEGTLP